MFSSSFRVKRAHLGFLIAAMIALALASASTRADTDTATIAALDSLTGDSTIATGKVVYVDFWASWCVPCRKSLPWMARMQERYRDQGLQVVTINLDRNADAGRKFLSKVGVDLPVVYDSAGKLAKLYDLKVMPTSFVYGRDGTLRTRHEGFDPEDTGEVESFIRKLLEEKPTP